MIKKIFIQNYKIFDHFDLDLNKDINIIVGDNEAGKSTILEAINLVLTKRLNGRLLEYELTPYLFHYETAQKYIKSIRDGSKEPPPKIIIEVYLDEDHLLELEPLHRGKLEALRGSMNSKKEDSMGIKIEITFNEDYKEEYENLIANSSDKIELIPSEYYKILWRSFANNGITSTRSLPIRLSYIDATTIRLQNGTDYYLQDIIKSGLDVKERVELSVAYRNLKEEFSKEDSIKKINHNLSSQKGAITNKNLSISIDVSQKSNWENHLIPHLDALPFHFIGKGEQNALKIMLALERKAGESNIILIEEPENHLSFSSMHSLISKIKTKCYEKQIIITTHSAYVLNKLGLEYLILICNKANKPLKLNSLEQTTQDYFKKLPGYDTLRLILAKKTILVEGPSDELIVQKAYKQKYGKLPIESGIDIISIRGLSFARFLDIAKVLKNDVVIITDNDGESSKKKQKYEPYAGYNNIKICISNNDTLKTLEPQIVNCNRLEVLNKILNKNFVDKEAMIKYMSTKDKKTECALKILETEESIKFPDYIEEAI